MATLQEKEFQQRMQQIERLVQVLEELPDPEARASAQELLQATLDLHGAGLERMLGMIVDAGAPGDLIIDEMANDDLVRNLLLLHGLHPLDLETRVTQALDKVRPYLATHGGNVELVHVGDDGVVRLRLQGSCNGCASSAMTLKLAIEEALQEFAPDMGGLAVEGVVPPPPPPLSTFIPLTQMGKPGKVPPPVPTTGRWEPVANLATLTTDSVRTLDVAGAPVLFCRLNGTFYAYGDRCPGCDHALDKARLAGATLTCPGCGLSYDIMRAGRCLDQPQLHLEPYPLLLERGQAKVALPVA